VLGSGEDGKLMKEVVYSLCKVMSRGVERCSSGVRVVDLAGFG